MAQKFFSTALAVVLPLVVAQQISKSTPEIHPQLPTWICTTANGCAQQKTSVVLDSNWRGLNQVANPSLSCISSPSTLSALCPDEATCAKNCEFEGADYAANGVSVSDDSLTLHQFLNGKSVSPRVFLLGSNGNYEMLQLNGQELRFDVDASTLVCGENGALYLNHIDSSGGRTANNPGGANYGTAYCDAQCPALAFRNGTINTAGEGFCCNEMDVWEANSQSTAMTPHVCAGSSCDTGGCGYNPYGQGAHSFYGPGLTVDTNKKITVLTQFLTHDGTTSGTLVDITRQYIVDGKLIQNPSGASVTTSFCSSADSRGGLAAMGTTLEAGMVLTFSIWNDNGGLMDWLDSGSSGPCSSSAGNPANILADDPGTYVTFSNIRWGDIDSTGGQKGNESNSTLPASATTLVTSTTTAHSGPTQIP